MRQFAMLRLSGKKSHRVPVHRINPVTKRTYCQIENAQMSNMALRSRLPPMRKFDIPPVGQPMCKNCERMYRWLTEDPLSIGASASPAREDK